MEIVKTICMICNMYCGLDVYAENGKVVKVHGMQEHPVNNICVKGYAMPEWVHSSERLLNPLIKKHGKFEEASWDEALDFIANKLADLKPKYGAKTLVINTGNACIRTLGTAMLGRLTNLYGSRNITSGSSYCFTPRPMGDGLTVGTYISSSRTGKTKCMVLWGINPQDSYPPKADSIYAARGRGAKLIVIDTRVIPLAKAADIYAQIRPGTDGALALGLLNVIIAEGLYDKAFVKEWTIGFDELVEHVKEYTPQKVEAITWVPAEMIKAMARMIAANTPVSITLGVSMDHCTSGIQTIRAIAIISAITGSVDVSGGSIYFPPLMTKKLGVEETLEEHWPVGADYPLFTKFSMGEQTVSKVTEQIVSEKPYPVKALIIQGSNPVVTWPNTNKVRKAFEKLELLVVVDPFMTDTAKMADVVLPCATFVEKEEIILIYMSHKPTSLVAKGRKVIEPIGNSWPDWKIWTELGKKMGYGKYFAWESERELIEDIFEPTNITYDQLDQNPGGVYHVPQAFRKYQVSGFPLTPSKKVEIYSQQMKDLGYDPLPTYHEPVESPVSRPDLAEKYPLILNAGARTVAYVHSRFRNVPSLRKLVPEPLVSIHSETAGKLGISDGDLVKVESPRGAIEIKAEVTDKVHPGVVAIPQGWSGEANINYLTDDEARDPVSAFPGWRALLCKVTKV